MNPDTASGYPDIASVSHRERELGFTTDYEADRTDYWWGDSNGYEDDYSEDSYP